MRVFATCDIGTAALRLVRERGLSLEVYPRTEAPPRQLILEKVAGGISGLITTLRDLIDAEILEAGRGSLAVVAQDAVGLDNIDVISATKCGVVVTHTPGVLTAATAEFALFMLGDLARGLSRSENLVRSGRWTGWHPRLPFLGTEISGLRIAVVGVGRIGRAFAARCVGLDASLLLCGRRQDPVFSSALEAEMRLRRETGLSAMRGTARWATFDECLKQADVVSLHVPLLRETHHLIDAAALARMKPTAFLLNTSRGAVVDEAALIWALRDGSIAGAALDVFDTEPLPVDSPLRAHDLTPVLRLYHHFGSGTHRTRLSSDPQTGMAGRCVDGLLAILTPQSDRSAAEIPWVVNPEALANFRPRQT